MFFHSIIYSFFYWVWSVWAFVELFLGALRENWHFFGNNFDQLGIPEKIIGARIEKNTTILSNRSKILQKRNKHSDYHIMIKYLSHYNNFIVNGPCNEKNIFKKWFFIPWSFYFIFLIILFNFLIKNISKQTFFPTDLRFDLRCYRLLIACSTTLSLHSTWMYEWKVTHIIFIGFRLWRFLNDL